MFRVRPASHLPNSIAGVLAFGVATALGPMRVIESRLAASGACAAGQACGSAPPDFLPRVTGEVRLLAEVQADGLRLLLWIAFAFSVLLAAGVAVNLATLALARASARRPEIALRAALGADPWGLIGKLLREALRIVLPGVVVGVALGTVGALLLDATWPVNDAGGTGTGAAGVVHRVVPAALAAVVLLTWLSPARPAWARDLRRWLAAASPGTVGPMGTAGRDLLVVLQVAASVLLLVTAGILLRGYGPGTTAAASAGIDARDTMALRLRLGGAEAVGVTDRAAAYERVLERVRALPEVVDTSLATEGAWLGLGVQDRVTALCLECYLGDTPKQMASGTATIHGVSPGYFAAMGVPVLEGREFDGTDRSGAAPVAVVSRAFAYRLFPNGQPTGKEIRLGGTDGEWYRVVGVADDVRVPAVGSPGSPAPAVYLSLLQHPPAAASLAVRTSGAGARPEAIGAVVRAAAGAGASVGAATTLERVLDAARAPLRWFAVLFGGVAAGMMVLALWALHGLMSYAVALRTREIGMRMALGAREASVVAMVLLRSLRLVGLGVVVGLIPLSGVGRLLQTRLAGAEPWDPPLIAAVAALLGAVALLASYGPARRAAALDPQAALRGE
ncbi:MAG TPA: FtsX-like permease family protein [Longimicrobiaceae bacterium]